MKTREINIIIKSMIALIIMILLCVIYSFILNIKDEAYRISQFYSNVEKDIYANVEDYTIYGNHLNFKGYLKKEEVSNINIEKVRLIIKSPNGYYNEISASLNNGEDRYNFELSGNINEGIDLNSLDITDTYILFIKASGNDLKGNYIEKIYSLDNKSSYNSNEYYTLTKNGKNNKIDIKFDRENNFNIMLLKSVETKLPNDVYDIVIDAGHGGKDPGAMYKEYNESTFTLDYVFALKQKLEEKGYKVKLTRDEDKYLESYGKNSRSAVPFETKAKLVLSIHLNSSNYDENEGGVEIYAPNFADLTFAKSFADNIVNATQCKYSINSYMRKLDGVYVRTFNQKEIDEFREEAENEGFKFYETITTDTNYLFMIRETGGKITGAYTDGRNTYGSNNIYKDENIAAEGYLLELGFINSSLDVNRLLNNKEDYINAIVKTIENHYN